MALSLGGLLIVFTVVLVAIVAFAIFSAWF